MNRSTKRSSFSGKIGFVLSAAGASVGLGNIWRFPYLAAKYGGGIFLLVYILLALTFGYTMIIFAGVQNEIERVSKFMIPVLVVLSVIIAAYSMTREGADDVSIEEATRNVEIFDTAIATCLLVIRVIGTDAIAAEVEKNGVPFQRKKIFTFMIRYLCMIIAVVILLSSVANVFGWITM